MHWKISALVLSAALPFYAQTAPPSPEKAWSMNGAPRLHRATLSQVPRPTIDTRITYSLPDLIDIAERNNPQTRVYWQRAREAAESLGVSRAALFPTLAAVASASINQYSLFDGRFHHENTTLFPSLLNLSWTALDFGARDAKIDVARANLLAADFAFNDIHRNLIFQVAQAYYRLLNALNQLDAAQAALADARTLRDAVEAKLANGLSTLPDVLDARAAAAQAEFDLASIRGIEQTAQGDLETLLGVEHNERLQISDTPVSRTPDAVDQPFRAIVERALSQRPDLLAQTARVQAADATVRQARTAFDPVVGFSGSWGHSNAIGQQKGDAEFHSAIYPWKAQVDLSWTVFDGGARRNAVERARSTAEETRAQLEDSRDRIENELWTAYVQLQTSIEQQKAADALLDAAEQSWTASLEAFQSGVRTFIDVSSAQKNLARARSARVSARLALLTSIANLAFKTGDSIPGTQH